MDENQPEAEVKPYPKKVILDFLLAALKTQAGYGSTIVAGKAQPILKIITPEGEAFNVTVK